MANKERLLQLADIVEKGHHKFNGVHAALTMGRWLMDLSKGYELTDFIGDERDRPDLFDKDANMLPTVDNCNTVACMAGFACLLFDYKKATDSTQFDYDKPWYDVEGEARKLLDLSFSEASHLFEDRTSDYITGPQAAEVIRHFAETGEIDWSRVLDGTPAEDDSEP